MPTRLAAESGGAAKSSGPSPKASMSAGGGRAKVRRVDPPLRPEWSGSSKVVAAKHAEPLPIEDFRSVASAAASGTGRAALANPLGSEKGGQKSYLSGRLARKWGSRVFKSGRPPGRKPSTLEV